MRNQCTLNSISTLRNNSAAENRPIEEKEEDDDTPESRLVARIVDWMLHGFQAKDKNVRLRCVQILGEMISYVGELE